MEWFLSLEELLTKLVQEGQICKNIDPHPMLWIIGGAKTKAFSWLNKRVNNEYVCECVYIYRFLCYTWQTKPNLREAQASLGFASIGEVLVSINYYAIQIKIFYVSPSFLPLSSTSFSNSNKPNCLILLKEN